MTNPLRGYISHQNRRSYLFKNLDNEGEGIQLYKPQGKGIRSLINQVFDLLSGNSFCVTIAGDPIKLDTKSAEAFFARNDSGVHPQASLQKKVLLLLEKSKGHHIGLPTGLLIPKGGKEGQKAIVGMPHQFRNLLQGLRANGFRVSFLETQLKQPKKPSFLSINREELIRQLIEENRPHLSQLTASKGKEQIQEFAAFLLDAIKKETS